MTSVAELGYAHLAERLAAGRLVIETGPLRALLKSRLSSVAEGLWNLYAYHRVVEPEDGADFVCEVRRPLGVRRFYRPQALFYADRKNIFKPLPGNQAFPMLEWGLNWCVGMQVKHFLLFHAACLEKNGRAVIMPAPPESGKSTLCAALACSGWRLLSDEATLVDLASGEARVFGLSRPVSLKNASVDVIRAFAPDAVLSERCHDTLKGSVAHMRPPRDSVQRANEPATPAWVVFPRYQPRGPAVLSERPEGETFMGLARNSFNYAALGARAFHRTVDIVEQAQGYDFRYSRLEEAIPIFEDLAAGSHPSSV
ncbi:HprK-related kinase A [Halorhodospira sp. 9621]|uniref:HprK-related kinase A n=1 Tax=Halorhodospira TaxID=85108 RepID=UPI001EE791E2|nr:MULTISPECIES: HprK-related kinase A [Halorhodospira]MCG5528025.1 HprK-related kinase A [Halorhodospira halophila]MCG5533890.1 HprK-related kinase A [Halorhodospira sp. 9621]MCG5542105.1 HprK-related kinase A [Halorhodospira sp. 9628]